MYLFPGKALAEQKERALALQVTELAREGKTLQLAAVLFTEDTGSMLYTGLKKEAAQRVGIQYQVHEFSMTDSLERVVEKIQHLNADPTITGIIIQKPYRSKWEAVISSQQRGGSDPSDFPTWWHTLTTALNETKDVDGLHPRTLDAIKRNTWRLEGRVLPATCRTVLTILDFALRQIPVSQLFSAGTRLHPTTQHQLPIAIVGKSDILGQPLFYELRNRHFQKMKLMGSHELQQLREIGVGLMEFPIIVTATGRPGLITGQLIADHAILIDVGEPQPDVDYVSIKNKAAFLTPVPGGVGPMTIVSLLENAVELEYNSRSESVSDQ